MGVSLIINSADFSEQGFYNPNINWIIDNSLTNEASNFLGSPLTGNFNMFYFPQTAGKKIRYIQFRCWTKNTTAKFPKNINIYDVDTTRKTATKVSKTFSYTITGVGPASYMTIDLGKEYLFTSGLGIYGFNEGLNEGVNLICGMESGVSALETPQVGVCRGTNSLLNGDLENVTYESSGTINTWMVDIRFGV